MKLKYEAPEAELICFRPLERLATDTFAETDALFNFGGDNTDPIGSDAATDPWEDWSW